MCSLCAGGRTMQSRNLSILLLFAVSAMMLPAQAPAPAATAQAPAPAASQAPQTPSAPAAPRAPQAPPSVVAGIPVNYDEAKVGTYTLIDPLVLANGKRVKDAKTWWTK